MSIIHQWYSNSTLRLHRKNISNRTKKRCRNIHLKQNKQLMQTSNQVLRAMMESEEVSLQATAEAREGFCCSKCDREVVPQFEGQEGKLSWT